MTISLTFTVDSGRPTSTPHGFTGLNPGLLAPLRKVATTLVAITILLALAATTSTPAPVPAEKPPRFPPPHSFGKPTSPLEATAQTFYRCMYDAHLPITASQNSYGDWTVVSVTPSRDQGILGRDEHGNTYAIGSFSVDPTDQDFFVSPRRDPALIIDGVDHSKAYAMCLSLSRYDGYAAWGLAVDPYPFDWPPGIQRMITANNKWAACARANGWPMVKDSSTPATPTPDFEWLKVRLPIFITVPELRHLLDVCPNFDPEMHQKYDHWWLNHPDADYPQDYLPDPRIDIDAWTIPLLPPHVLPTIHEQILITKLRALYAVLDEPATQYYEHVDDGWAYSVQMSAGRALIYGSTFSDGVIQQDLVSGI